MVERDPNHSYSGFVGDTSEVQEEVLDAVTQWVKESKVIDLERVGYDEHDMLRFCRARKFVIADIKVMIENLAQWRAEEGIDDIITEFQMPKEEEDAMLKAHSFFYHGVDKLGRPIFIDRIGIMDL